MSPPKDFTYAELAGDDPVKKDETPATNGTPRTGKTTTAEPAAGATTSAPTAETTETEAGDSPETPAAQPSSKPAVGAVGATVLAGSQPQPEEQEEHATETSKGDENDAKEKPSAVEFPVGLSARQKRLFLRNELKKALDAGDVQRCKTISQLQEELDDRHERRLTRDGALRKADRENPYDPNLLEVYAEVDIAWVVQKFCKAIRWDASALGLVGGVATLLLLSAKTEGGVSMNVLRAQTKSMCWKIKERFHGLGKEWVTDGNQIQRLDAAARGKRVPESQWLRRHPLPGPEAWDREFDSDWQSWLAKSGISAEGE